MQVILGQEKLIQQIDKFSLQTMPKTLLLLGPRGSGKHLIVEYISEHLGIPITAITEKTSAEELAVYSLAQAPSIFLIDCSTVIAKQQNQFLKFIEEPSALAYNILLAESETSLLPTILNRCVKFFLAPYTKSVLKQLFPEFTDDSIFEICTTPGQLRDVSQKQLSSLCKLCNDLLCHLKDIDYSSLLRLELLINYKEEYDYFDFNQFLAAFTLAAFKKFAEAEDEFYFDIYKFCSNEQSKLIDKVFDKERFMLSFLDRLWRLTQKWIS